jgi:hypothetical protein
VRLLKDAGGLPAAAPQPPEALRLDDLSVDIDIAGAPRQPTGTIAAAVGDLAFEGRTLGPLTLSAEGSDGTARFDLDLSNHRADVTGSIGLEPAWPFEAHVNLRESQLSSVLALLGPTAAPPDSSGTVTASADLEGWLDRPLESSGVVFTLSELEGQLRGKPLTLVQPGRLRFEGRRATVEEPLRMTLGGFSLGVGAPAEKRDSGGIVATLRGV